MMKNKEQKENFRSLLGLKEYYIMKVIEKTTLESLRDTFEGENIKTHYKVLAYEIIFIFMAINLQWRLIKKYRQDRDISHEIERQSITERNWL